MAVEIARGELPGYLRDPSEDVLSAEQGSFRDLGGDLAPTRSSSSLPPDMCVWRINIGHRSGPQIGQGMFVVIGCLTGAVIQAYEWTS
jgi:hypothetical protein